ncbi:hypothetical protein [Hahella ganghwensis]|uniref:hypothetical protein n=1 Tax=Hahella ganghwensis TaxID=286420 RepID=UPI00035D11FB|nr:hypothetical protein [Hahella ganghwensis]
MNVKSWFSSATDIERAKVAALADTSVNYLKQLAGYHRNPSRHLAERLEAATKEVTPDRVVSKYEAVFPELDESDAA